MRPPGRLLFFAACAPRRYTEVRYRADDILVFGCESRGLPAPIRAAHVDATFGIPLASEHVRSLNLANAVSRAISRGGSLYHTNPDAFKAALRAHRYSDKTKLEDNVFELAYSMVAPAMPSWGNMNQEGWQKVLDFSVGAGIIKDRAKAPSAKEGVLWTNKYASK